MSVVTSALACAQWVIMVSVVGVWTLTSVPVIRVCRVNSVVTLVAVILVLAEVVTLMLAMVAVTISTSVPSMTEHAPMDVLTIKEDIHADVKTVHSKSATVIASARQMVLNSMYQTTHPVINRDGSQAQSNVQLAVALESVTVVVTKNAVVANLAMG